MEHRMLERDATLERPRIAGQDRNGIIHKRWTAADIGAGLLQTSECLTIPALTDTRTPDRGCSMPT